MRKVNVGSAWPLGSSVTPDGVNFSIAAPHASNVELLIFQDENDDHPIEIISLDQKNRSGDYWHVELEGLSEGALYGYKISNDKSNPLMDNLVLDPCARAITGWRKYKRNQKNNLSTGYCHFLKGVVTNRDQFDFKSHPRPKHKWNKTIIYELHVGGFTKNPDSNISDNKKGTFVGLIEKIPYLKNLGITSIELLPIFAFDSSDAPEGLENYWGYSPINWFTPHQGFVDGYNPLEARKQFKQFVEVCHDNGLEVLIDVVYNHTTEGNQDGPIISWKNFGPKTFYHQDEEENYQDVTGCGNTIAANRPLVRKLILESLHCWAVELGVDGFRFDLGIALSRGENLIPLDEPPLFEEIEIDPKLSDVKLISEPWDCGGLYKLSNFPARKFRTWNGHFRDDIRRFWKSEKGTIWQLKDRLIGNKSLYNNNLANIFSINFITSHDGFTLKDLVSFNKKHNLANGENNRDGENHNNSFNYGVEGPTTNKQINNLRQRQQRNLLSSLLLSPGIPMMLMGDEVGRSQGGNNNTWCQDNPLGWMTWDHQNCDHDLKDFVIKLISLRKQLSEFFSPSFVHIAHEDNSKEKTPDLWIQWHGIKVNKPDWGEWSHTLGYSINKKDEGSAIWLGFNAYKETMVFELPKPTSPWKKYIDTSLLKNKNVSKKPLANQSNISMESYSLVLLVANEYSKKIKL
ncbi:glycogen debranching protein [Prochlorococcus marinus]|uniref:Glycogen debranching enzyme n=1 Tax=Prochlorococcus marinus XMU1408 TaxID=2213228 RepID=A0A318QXJ7_PROMR|nr:isoamylase [Prochlorococcus marinus]MBW3042506.1 glycogen debranching enzyme [Prochlorococcus marinus str. XMU1408]PYE01235.1 glycogen debranching enzyme [Prochlorococcus marinus XMU1408]